MKKTMLAILMLIISCAATNLYGETTYQPTIYTKNNKFYSSKPYCYTEWEQYSNILDYQFLHKTEDNKTYFKIRRIIKSKLLRGDDNYIILVLDNGKEYKLDYCKETNYTDGTTEIEAICEIDDFTNIAKIIYIQNGYYYAGSTSISSSHYEYFNANYNALMQEVEKLKK